MGGIISRIPRPALHARFPFLFIVNRRLTNLVSSTPPGPQPSGGRHEAVPRLERANINLRCSSC